MKPLVGHAVPASSRPDLPVNLREEIERVEPEVSTAFRIVSREGYDPGAVREYQKLRARLAFLEQLAPRVPVARRDLLEEAFRRFQQGVSLESLRACLTPASVAPTPTPEVDQWGPLSAAAGGFPPWWFWAGLGLVLVMVTRRLGKR